MCKIGDHVGIAANDTGVTRLRFDDGGMLIEKRNQIEVHEEFRPPRIQIPIEIWIQSRDSLGTKVVCIRG